MYLTDRRCIINVSNNFVDVDYVTPLCSQVTYEGLIDDIFEIKTGKIANKTILGYCEISKFVEQYKLIGIHRKKQTK